MATADPASMQSHICPAILPTATPRPPSPIAQHSSCTPRRPHAAQPSLQAGPSCGGAGGGSPCFALPAAHPSMLRRRDLQQRLLSAAWQVAAAEQQRGAHRAAGRSGGGGPQASGGRHTSSSTSTASGDHDAAKRERRRQRRARNRELRERVCLNSAGVDFAASWQASRCRMRGATLRALAVITFPDQAFML